MIRPQHTHAPDTAAAARDPNAATAVGRRHAALVLAVVLLLGALLVMGCDQRSATSGGAAPTASGVASAAGPSPAGARPAATPVRGVVGLDASAQPDDGGDDEEHDAACAPQGAELKPMELLAFTWASEVDGRDPKDKLTSIAPGKRAFAHLRMRNRSGRKRCVKVKFRVGGKPRPAITLKIGDSWSWRTWAYSTPRADDRGKMEVTVTDDQGNVIVNEALPIVP